MFTGKTLENYCLLSLKKGVNIQKGQGLVIICPTEHRKLALQMTKTAYKLGAKIVEIRWEDEEILRQTYLNAQTETLINVPKWFVDSKNFLVKENYCYVAINGDDPQAFYGLDENKIAKVIKAKSEKLKAFNDAVMSNKIRWCVNPVPTKKWARKVFPHSKNSLFSLQKAIERTMRLDLPNPVEAWDKHIEKLESRAKFLNDNQFSYLHFESSNGTDIMVGLAKQHIWTAAKEKSADGIDFIANMPTEEIFTSPHKDKVDGVVKSALPLSYNGQIIDRFSLTFKRGKVVDFSAEIGYDVLKNLLRTDKGVSRLGEVALIGKNSPIAKENILFYNTLFDENASCHFALGKAYPTTVKAPDNKRSSLSELGLNDSAMHIDFMIGTKDTKITGIKKDNTSISIFDNGEWLI